jgi:PIN domain nuclease of toxin-antitoxin system
VAHAGRDLREAPVILLDTQVVAWTVGGPERLSKAARRAVERESRRSGLFIASATLYELAQLAASGAIRIKRTPAEWLKDVVREAGLGIRDITTDIAAVAAHLPTDVPADPFDRLITATAIVERIPLVTADGRIRASRVVKTIW